MGACIKRGQGTGGKHRGVPSGGSATCRDRAAPVQAGSCGCTGMKGLPRGRTSSRVAFGGRITDPGPWTLLPFMHGLPGALGVPRPRGTSSFPCLEGLDRQRPGCSSEVRARFLSCASRNQKGPGKVTVPASNTPCTPGRGHRASPTRAAKRAHHVAPTCWKAGACMRESPLS